MNVSLKIKPLGSKVKYLVPKHKSKGKSYIYKIGNSDVVALVQGSSIYDVPLKI